MTPDQIREQYLSFFEGHGHTRHPSDGLVPENDPTLLFTGAGMNQFKAEFMGKGTLPFTRATTSQKCLRMPDLENVGRTASHHTFFEMLGNFSFGDYFKEEAIRWAWGFLVDTLGVPADRLAVTVYKDDDEAEALWADGVGVPRERIFRCDEDENFWPASAPSKGPNGICGPCSEIYFDFFPERGPLPPAGPGEDGARLVEIWNLVFTQFERRDGGALEPLPHRNIDTGMGFERTVRVLESLEQGEVLPSNFETQLFAPIMAEVHQHIGRQTEFGTPDGERTRRIADHVRAAAFCIADGVQPSNEKQGYVVRKILRRAMLDRHLLGGDLRSPWLAELSQVVIHGMGGAWPELREAQSLVSSVIAAEEERFAGAFLSGTQRLGTLAKQSREGGSEQLSGEQAFLLYDTFGLPLDMQKQLLESDGMQVDEEGFREAMAEQRRRSRESSKISDSIFDEGPLASVSGNLPPTQFVRGALTIEGANILAVVDDSGDEGADSNAERRVVVVLDRTPFYAEGGGQVGDRGALVGQDFRIDIDDVVSLRGISLHRGAVVDGEALPGNCSAQVDEAARLATSRNHTATHLLHAALHSVLGDDVTQAGSLVAPDRLRFDFRFPRGLTDLEVEEVESLVNAWILSNAKVSGEEMTRDAARDLGAMALFGEKYGDVVRVVQVPGQHGRDSLELCGGTHIARSGDIGMLRITSETSIASGIRRIEARTAAGVLKLLREDSSRLARAAALFKSNPEALEERISSLQVELKSARKELDESRASMVKAHLADSIQERHGLRVLATVVSGVPVKNLREIAGDAVKSSCDLALLGTSEGGGTSFLVASGKAAQAAGLPAREIVERLCSALDGKGGGNASFAQGRGKAHEKVQTLLEEALNSALGAIS
ncbi:MAG: alanine--tRNA ligase [Planctomycetota bacterium]|jgi:alanyl-tRNA synthetase|nr:alanine--tRNA ligase [Planctomycetota bacterium]